MDAKARKRGDAAEPDVIVDHADGSHDLASHKADPSPRRRRRVKIGGVYVTGDRATVAQVKRAVSTSTDMLHRLGQAGAQPGEHLRAAKDIPLFSADPEHPDRFLRKLNGKVERGVLVNGTFSVVD